MQKGPLGSPCEGRMTLDGDRRTLSPVCEIESSLEIAIRIRATTKGSKLLNSSSTHHNPANQVDLHDPGKVFGQLVVEAEIVQTSLCPEHQRSIRQIQTIGMFISNSRRMNGQ
jgi:hypothetical protein